MLFGKLPDILYVHRLFPWLVIDGKVWARVITAVCQTR